MIPISCHGLGVNAHTGNETILLMWSSELGAYKYNRVSGELYCVSDANTIPSN